MINILIEKCVGCKLCISTCPFDAIKVTNRKAAIQDNCTLCGACVSSCKFEAIDFQKDESEGVSDLTSYKGVWVFGEQKNNMVTQVVTELLGEGRKLADTLSVPLSVVLIGQDVAGQAQSLISDFSDHVYLYEKESLKN